MNEKLRHKKVGHSIEISIEIPEEQVNTFETYLTHLLAHFSKNPPHCCNARLFEHLRFGFKLQTLFDATGLSFQQYANELGCSVSELRAYMRAEQEPPTFVLLNLARLTNLPIEILFSAPNPPPQKTFMTVVLRKSFKNNCVYFRFTIPNPRQAEEISDLLAPHIQDLWCSRKTTTPLEHNYRLPVDSSSVTTRASSRFSKENPPLDILELPAA